MAVVGAGPVGLAAIMTSALVGASRIIAIDLAPSRLARAKEFGATHTIESGDDVEQQVAELTDGMGVRVAMEAVGIPDTFDLCTRLVRPGGVVANIGVHGAPTTLHLEELWIKSITITTGLVSATTVPTLLQLVRDGRLDAEKLRDAPLRARGHHAGLRRVQRAQRERRAQSRPATRNRTVGTRARPRRWIRVIRSRAFCTVS